MAIDVELRHLDGHLIEDLRVPFNALSFPYNFDFRGYDLIHFIDPYGRTVFNKLQMDAFLSDIRKLKQLYEDHDVEILFLENVERLAEKCKTGVDLFLVFEGD